MFSLLDYADTGIGDRLEQGGHHGPWGPDRQITLEMFHSPLGPFIFISLPLAFSQCYAYLCQV